MFLKDKLGKIDIYLIDQLMKGRFDDVSTVLDAGCGNGRNLPLFTQIGANVYGIDSKVEAIDKLKAKYDTLEENFTVGQIDTMPYRNYFFDVVVCSAVLHFARNEKHFFQMLDELYRVLAINGLFFIRVASSFAIDSALCKARGEGRYLLNDGTERFLLTPELLIKIEHKYSLERLDKLKTTNVDNLRSMSTLVWKKKG